MDAHYDHISEEDRYGLGVDTDSGKHFLAIPVTNGVADYNEYYEITREMLVGTDWGIVSGALSKLPDVQTVAFRGAQLSLEQMVSPITS